MSDRPYLHRLRQWRHASVALPLFIIIFFIVVLGIALINSWRDPRNRLFQQWQQVNIADRAGLITVQHKPCPGAPFILPADGFIGLLYGDPRGPYSNQAPHQGIDIFSDTEPGLTPVYAAYDGYVQREKEWRSTLIMRVPQDPLQPDRQIWLYYTHMADRAGNDFIVASFPPGTAEFFVEQGTLLGYTGDYNGNSPRTVWVHLHFSIVQDDGNGRYTNELDIRNTIDPSPYLGMNVKYACVSDGVATCSDTPTCA
jgi:murein DD-endopeptidase MepM/ murein hydrolase activator NlpD